VNGILYFASEIKSILAVAPELAETNYQGLMQYMYFGYIPDPQTAFQRIHKLPPGHLLEFEKGEIKIRQYWDLPEYGTHEPKSEEECLEELEERLTEAVRIRLIADVPLGAMLSGGTDSSTVVALMSRVSSGPVKTFSIGFQHADFNEAAYARKVAEHFETDHHELILDPDVVETVDTLRVRSKSRLAIPRCCRLITFRSWHVSTSRLLSLAMAATKYSLAMTGIEFILRIALSIGFRDGQGVSIANRFMRVCHTACRPESLPTASPFRGKSVTSKAFHSMRLSATWACCRASFRKERRGRSDGNHARLP
jgi:hypothetical protein